MVIRDLKDVFKDSESICFLSLKSNPEYTVGDNFRFLGTMVMYETVSNENHF